MSRPADLPAADLQAAMSAAGLQPGRSPEPARLPGAARLFAARAARLRKLADGHMLADWLRFVALLADAQHAAINRPAPISASNDPAQAWTAYLPILRDRLSGALPAAALAVADGAIFLDPAALSALGERIAAGEPTAQDLPVAPFIAAAQQLAWTRYAAGLEASALTVSATQNLCPVCGAPPVAGVIHGGAGGGLRYLHCGVCHAAWHRVRSACVACGESLSVEYRDLEGVDSPARAELCGSCRSYTKLFPAEKAPDLDVVADDLASLALDVLVGEEGYQRFGFNPLMLAAE
jgi:FdhE protein